MYKRQELRQTINQNNETLQHQLMEYWLETKQQITETNEKLEETLEKLEKTNKNVSEIREEVLNKMNHLEGENKRKIEEGHEETIRRCTQMDQDLSLIHI